MVEGKMKVKLTDKKSRTYGGMTWQVGVTNHATGKGTKLCTDGVLHYYDSPELAVLMNPIHREFDFPIAYEVEGECVVTEGVKSGAKSLTPIRVIELPVFTAEQRIAFAIFCAKELCKDPDWNTWADNWLDGKDRAKDSAMKAFRKIAGRSLIAMQVSRVIALSAFSRDHETRWWVAHLAVAASYFSQEYDHEINFTELAKNALLVK